MLSGSNILAVPEGYATDHGLKTLKGARRKPAVTLFKIR
jgi:hypothetical protein